MATRITIDANVQKFVDQIDKAGESIEHFAKQGNKAIDDLGDSYGEMSEKQKRSFDASKRQFNENIDKIKQLEKEYESLRAKQKSGAKLSEEEADRLKKINREYKNLKGAVAQTSREMNNLARGFKKVESSENAIKTKTPSVTHQMANLAVEAINVKTAVLAAAGALASFGLDAEKQIKSFSAVTDSLTDAVTAYRQLQDVNSKMNFETEDLDRYARMLLNVGVSADKLGSVFDRLADAIAGVGGDSSNFDELMDIFLRIENIGRMTMEDLEALQELGFKDILQNMSTQITNGDTHNLYKQIQDEAVDSDTAINAINNYFKQFEGAQQKAADNTIDIWNKAMKDAAAGAGELGSALLDSSNIKEAVEWLAEVAVEFKNASRDYRDGIISLEEMLERTLGSGFDVVKWGAAFFAASKGVDFFGNRLQALQLGKINKEIKDTKKAVDNVTSALALVSGNQEVMNMISGLIGGNDIKQIAGIAGAEKVQRDLDAINKKVEESTDLIQCWRDKIAADDTPWGNEAELLADRKGLEAEIEKQNRLIEERKKLLDQRDKYWAMADGAADIAGGARRPTKSGPGGSVGKNKGRYSHLGAMFDSGLSKTLAGNKKEAKNYISSIASGISYIAHNPWETIKKTVIFIGKKVKGIVSTVKLMFTGMGAGAMTGITKGFTAIAGVLGTTLTPALILAAGWAKSLMDSLGDFDKFDWVSLFDKASAGEGPLDPDDPEDPYNKAREAVKRGQEAAKYKKINDANAKKAAEKAKEDAEKAEEQKRINEEKYQLELEREREYQKALADLRNQAAAADLEQAQHVASEKLNTEAKFFADMTALLQNYGAEEAAQIAGAKDRQLEKQRALLDAENEYAKQKLDIEQQIAALENDRQFETDARNLDLLNRQIEELSDNLDTLMENHNNDVIKIKIEADVADLQTRLNEKVNELLQNNEFEDQGTVGSILKAGKDQFNFAQNETLAGFNQDSNSLAEAYANNDMNGVLGIGAMFGLDTQAILEKGESIKSAYDMVAEAMVNAYGLEIEKNQEAFDAVNEHAEGIRTLQDYVKDYCISMANNFASAFSDWITGAKSAGQAIKDFAAGLIQSVIQMAAQFAGLCAILAAFGVIPPGPVAAKMMFGYGGDHTYAAGSRGDKLMKKARGGYISGPGTGDSDSIPAMLSNGEYVLNSRAVDAIGVGKLDTMNKTGRIPGSKKSIGESLIPNSSQNLTLNISAVDAASFSGFLKRGGLNKIKQAMFDDSRNFAGLDGVF